MRNDFIARKTYYSFVLVSILSSLTATVGILIDNILVGCYLGLEALGATGIVGPVSLVYFPPSETSVQEAAEQGLHRPWDGATGSSSAGFLRPIHCLCWQSEGS